MLSGWKTQIQNKLIYTQTKRNESTRKTLNETESVPIPYMDRSSPIWYTDPGVKSRPGDRLL
jgi:hypothetical protein